MKNNKNKGFTLVELIIIMIILSVLATLAFISISNYANDSRNSKVLTDLQSLAGAIEVYKSRYGANTTEIGTNLLINNKISNSSLLNNSGTTIGGLGTRYTVGNVDFKKIKQNGENFTDPNSYDKKQHYIYAAVHYKKISSYQLAGQIIDNGTKKAKLNGTYSQIDEINDSISLISTKQNDIAIEDEKAITGDLYQ